MNLLDLTKKRCKPCEGGVKPLERAEAQELLKVLPEWHLSSDGREVVRILVMEDFLTAVELINQISRIAEEEDHHPDIRLTGYRNLEIRLSTHAIGGLSENDFILAGKIEQLPKKLKA